MTKLQKIIKHVGKLNDKFVNPMFKQSDIYVFRDDTIINGFETKIIEDSYDQMHSSWKVPGVYIFLNAKGEPIYCGEAARHLWGRVYDYFAKNVTPMYSELHSRYSWWDEVPSGVVLFYILSNDEDDAGMEYALETRILNNVDLKFNKKKNRK